MPESFRTLEDAPPLRLTIRDIAKLGDELMRHASCGGEVTIEYLVAYDDGVHATHDGTAGFVESALAAEDDPSDVSVRVYGWSPDRKIERYYSIDFHRFATSFHVAGSDANWGRGATQTMHVWLRRHSPRYAGLLRIIPFVTGLLFAVPFLLVVATAKHERAATEVFWLVLALSAVALLATAWFARLALANRILPHTSVTRESQKRNIRGLARSVAGAVAFVANIASIIVYLTH